MKNDHILVLLAVLVFFGSFGSFSPQLFGQVNEQPILKLHEMVRALDAPACPIFFFFFFDDQDWQGGVLKLIKNIIFSVILAVFIFSAKCLVRLMIYLYQKGMK